MKNDKRAESESKGEGKTEGVREDGKVKGTERKGKVTLREECGGERAAGF